MAILKCKMCGGELDIVDDSNVVECEYCGSKQTIPDVDDEKKLRLYDRANKLRMACDYDKAAGVYESIVAEFPDEAEAYWGLILCKYGIEYVDDPATGKKIPTCHRSSFDSVMKDSSFEMVMENADPIALKVYREEAKQIEEIRKRIVEISNSAEDYDIFICYKETAEDGNRTIDSVIAQDVYDALTAKGYKVFFSRVSLEDKLGQEYEPYIFSALNTSEIMLAFGTEYEYYNAVWVKNEWSRFLKLMEKDTKKHLIPCYKNIDAYDMPEEFAKLQAQDMGKIGAIQDLIRGIEKLIGSKTVAESKVELVHNDVDLRATALVKRGYLSLEDEEADLEIAKDYFDQALNYDAENAEAYVGLFLVDMERGDLASFAYCKTYEFENLKPNKKYIEKSDKVSEAITNFSIPNMLKASVIEHKLEYDLSYDSIEEPLKKCIDKYKSIFERNKNWNNAIRFATDDYKEELKRVEKEILDFFQEKLIIAQKEDVRKKSEISEKYEAFIDEKYAEIEEEYKRLDKLRQSDYENACVLMESAKDARDYKNAAEKFKDLGDYKDCITRSIECENKNNRLLDEQRRKEEFATREEQSRRAKKRIITIIAVVAVVIVCVVLLSVINKKSNYNNAIKLFNDGNYEEAMAEFRKLDEYKDSREMEKYMLALIALEEKNYDEAYKMFSGLEGFMDSEEYLARFREMTLPSAEKITGDHHCSKEYSYTINDGVIESVNIEIYNDYYKECYFSNDTITVTYEYNSDGDVIHEKGVNGSGITVIEIDYTYDSNGNMTKEKIVNPEGVIINIAYEYNNGKLIKSCETKSDSFYQHDCTYNDKGDVISRTISAANVANSEVIESNYSYEYDDEGKKQSCVDDYFGNYDINSQYEYDDKGNVKTITIKAQDQTTVTTIDYLYYYTYIE